MDPEVVSAVKRRHDDLLMAIEGVVGTGISRDPAGTLAIEVYVDHLTDELSRLVPKTLEGVPVNLVETGSFTAR